MPNPATTTVPTLPHVSLGGPFGSAHDFFQYTAWNSVWEHVVFFWNIYSVVAIIVSLLFFVGMVYAKIRYAELSDIESEEIRYGEQKWALRNAKIDSRSTRWKLIEQNVHDRSPDSWRLAIIDADILLDETLTKAGYIGKTIGEKLKTANTQSFKTVQDAWDAHKVRNDIAHVGSDFVLTQRTAQETIVKFERVFKEFGVL